MSCSGVAAVTVLVMRYGTPYIRILVENREPSSRRSGARMLSPTVSEPSTSWWLRGSATIANNSDAGAATSTERLTWRGPASTVVTVMTLPSGFEVKPSLILRGVIFPDDSRTYRPLPQVQQR